MARYMRIRVWAAAIALSSASVPRANACCDSMDGNGLIHFAPGGEAVVKEGLLDLAVEQTSPGPTRAYASLRILSRRPVDTSLFYNIGIEGIVRDSVVASLSYDASGFPDTLVDSTSGYPFAAGDTLRNVFVMQVTLKGMPAYWRFRGAVCKFLPADAGPFPIAEALAALGRYMDSIQAAKGQPAGSGKVKLGPVFTQAIGGPDGTLTAKPTADAWIIRLVTGNGDCAAGCIYHQNTFFQVTRTGSVSLTTANELFGICSPSGTTRPGPRKPGHGRTLRFTPAGRRIPGIVPPRATPWVEAPR